MNKQPETEAFIDSLNDDWDVEFAALTSHAYRLEWQRDVAVKALKAIAGMDTSQDVFRNQCGAVLLAMFALDKIKDANQ